MANNIDEVVKSIQESFVEACGDLSEYELSIIDRSIKLPMNRTFTSKMAMVDSVHSMISTLSELNYLKNQVIKRRYELNVKHRVEYDKQFTLLTRIGRPSRQAIESEIYSSSELLNSQRDKLEEFDNVLEFLETQIDLIHAAIDNYKSAQYGL